VIVDCGKSNTGVPGEKLLPAQADAQISVRSGDRMIGVESAILVGHSHLDHVAPYLDVSQRELHEAVAAIDLSC
jgi:ribonuclease BN (tRNA processing enzyme)